MQVRGRKSRSHIVTSPKRAVAYAKSCLNAMFACCRRAQLKGVPLGSLRREHGKMEAQDAFPHCGIEYYVARTLGCTRSLRSFSMLGRAVFLAFRSRTNAVMATQVFAAQTWILDERRAYCRSGSYRTGARSKPASRSTRSKSQKSIQEIEAPASGTLKIVAQIGGTYAVGAVLAEIL